MKRYTCTILHANDPMLPISFEFYPPKTDEQRVQLDRSVQRLKAHKPQFMSVTFGAGGSTLSHTPETVQRLRSEHDVAGVPHLTCVGGNREEIRSLLKLYRALGCNRIVALRDGDWKYLRVDGHDYLFNIPADERERANQAGREPARLAAMRAAWEAWEATMPPIPADATVSLGYSVKDMPQR